VAQANEIMDELARIQTFIRVVEAGSFSAAARGVSSISSAARQVKSLEDEMGVRLLNRSTRSLSLTEPGRQFYERVCKISNDLMEARMEAQSYKESVKGMLRVSLRVSAGSTVIIPALPNFLEQYPDLCLDVTLSDERTDLIAQSIDVAVWIGAIPDSNLVARRLSPPQRIVCASPAYFERHGKPLVPEDLQQHNCLIYTHRPNHDSWRFSKDGVDEEVKVKGVLRTDNGTALLSAGLAGLGLFVVNEWMVRRLIEEGRLNRVLDDYTVSPNPGDAALSVVYPSSRGMSLKVRAFVDFLLELFSGPDEGRAISRP